MIRARVLHAGEARGPVLVLTEPVSFWGGFDPKTGMIVDVHHPQHGATLTGRIILIPETRGSGTAPGAIAESIRRGTAPAGIIMRKADINIATGAAVAAELYGRACPVLVVDEDDYRACARAKIIRLGSDGRIHVSATKQGEGGLRVS